MGIFKRLFSPESGSKTIDAITSGIDSAVYTPQEKANMKLKLLEALAPFKVVQRILAFAAALHWLIAGVNVVASIWIKAYTNGAIDVTEPMLEYALSDFVLWPTMAVFALYFTGGVLESKNKKG
jgi:hypothetical protein